MANRDTQSAPTTGGIFADLYDIGLSKFKEVIDFEDAASEADLARSVAASGDAIEMRLAPKPADLFGGFDTQSLLIVGGLAVLAVVVLTR